MLLLPVIHERLIIFLRSECSKLINNIKVLFKNGLKFVVVKLLNIYTSSVPRIISMITCSANTRVIVWSRKIISCIIPSTCFKVLQENVCILFANMLENLKSTYLIAIKLTVIKIIFNKVSLIEASPRN